MSKPILFLPPYSRGEKKNIWSELELNPSPLDAHVTTLTTNLGPTGQMFQIYPDCNSAEWRFIQVSNLLPWSPVGDLKSVEKLVGWAFTKS